MGSDPRNPWSNAMSEGEREERRVCRQQHRAWWWVSVYKANYSWFNGRRRTPSDYSEVRCGECGRRWRTKAAYVEALPMRNPREGK